ncbi:MAG: ABC transporter ATP-binding protein [Pseudomonadota bacterium]
MTAIVELTDLTIRYGDIIAVAGLSLSLQPGGCLGIVGESGSGKSQTGLALMGLLPKAANVSGAIRFGGLSVSGAQRRERIAMVYQDPQSSLTPHMRIAAQLAEGMAHPAADKIEAALRRAGLPDPTRVAKAYPHALSGGMRQRAMLAMALARQPDLIIADEPTTALDATVQMELLQEFVKIKQAGTAIMLISHDIGVVAGLADDVMVMKSGAVVEAGPAETVLTAPQHDYTRELIAASVIKAQSTCRHNPAKTPRIAVQGLSKTYRLGGDLFAQRRSITALHPIDVTLHDGETLAIVGESGSGKSTLAKLILGLEQPSVGRVTWDGADIAQLSAAQLRAARTKVQPIFQDPFASFDPQRSLGASIQDAIDMHHSHSSVTALLADVGLPPDFAAKYPHEASGGQNQRAAIARALACAPDILICDETLSALDKTTQTQVLALLAKLKREKNLSMLFISHDLDVVRAIADRVVILKDGRLVEEGSVDDIYERSSDPYTCKLLAAQTVPDVAAMRAKISAFETSAPAP